MATSSTIRKRTIATKEIEIDENAKQEHQADIFVNLDIKEVIPNPKKARIELDEDIKVKCLRAITDFYDSAIIWISQTKVPVMDQEKDGDWTQEEQAMAAKNAEKRNGVVAILYQDIKLGNQICSIAFTCHGIRRQTVSGTNETLSAKAGSADFILSTGKDKYNLARENALLVWDGVTKNQGLKYKKFDKGNKSNWIGTMSPYLDFFGMFALRMKELRIGYTNMLISKNRQKTVVSVKKYGLDGYHSVLLEGITFPPDRRSSAAQSVGPMTAFMCMLTNTGKYRTKWEDAVKRAMSHIPLIDDLIAATRTRTTAAELRPILSVLADILLLTTSKQASRVAFPLAMFAYVVRKFETQGRGNDIGLFNTSGHGAFYFYSEACKAKFSLGFNQDVSVQKAQQLVFHAMFGTFKEDLSILAQITAMKVWFTRKEMGNAFKSMGSSTRQIVFQPIDFIYYSKLSAAKMTDRLSGVYSQICTVPVFSGMRVVNFQRNILNLNFNTPFEPFGERFFEQARRKINPMIFGNTLQQIRQGLTIIHEECLTEVEKRGKKLTMTTVQWRDFKSITSEGHGDVVDVVVNGSNKFYMG